MEIAPFELERYFAKHEFSAQYLLSSSDCEALSLTELLELADKRTMRIWQELKLGYTETMGHPLLRAAIAELYAGIKAEDILVAAPEECIYLLMHALLDPGDHVVCTFPGYQSLYEVAHSIGCQVSTWEPHEEHNWRFAVEDLAGMLQANTKLVVANFPHNPTGYVPPIDEFQDIVDTVRVHGAYLFADEMYRFLEIDKGTTLPAACQLYERAISLFGMSKTFGLPGLRLGWLASQENSVLEKVSMLKDYTTICSSAPSEVLAIIALLSRESIIAQQIHRVRRNVGILETFFNEYAEIFRWNRPMGGSICFPRMLAVESTSAFCEQLVEEESILLAPARAFQFGDQHVRVGFGRENLPQVLERFAHYIERRFR